MKSEKKREKKPPKAKAKVRKGTLKQVLRYVGKISIFPFADFGFGDRHGGIHAVRAHSCRGRHRLYCG